MSAVTAFPNNSTIHHSSAAHYHMWGGMGRVNSGRCDCVCTGCCCDRVGHRTRPDHQSNLGGIFRTGYGRRSVGGLFLSSEIISLWTLLRKLPRFRLSNGRDMYVQDARTDLKAVSQAAKTISSLASYFGMSFLHFQTLVRKWLLHLHECACVYVMIAERSAAW